MESAESWKAFPKCPFALTALGNVFQGCGIKLPFKGFKWVLVRVEGNTCPFAVDTSTMPSKLVFCPTIGYNRVLLSRSN